MRLTATALLMPIYQVVWIELVGLWYHEHEIWSFGKCGVVYILIFGNSRTKGEIFFILGGILLLFISASQLEPHYNPYGPDLDLEPFWKKIACASCFPNFADIYIRPRIPSVAVLYSVCQSVSCLELSPSQG